MFRKKLLMLLTVGLMASSAFGYPVDPSKVSVGDVDVSQLTKEYTLAYDSVDHTIVYYAPKGGRVADLNGQPLFGYALLPNGKAIVNATFDFGAYGAERALLLKSIQEAGYEPVPLPYFSTMVIPLGIGALLEEDNRTPACAEITHPETGKVMQTICDGTLFEEVFYLKEGPTLNQHVPVFYKLNQTGGLIYRQFLRSGNALQIALKANYWAAGSAFKAEVKIDYDKFFEQFHSYAAFHDGRCIDIEIETFFQKIKDCSKEQNKNGECSIKVKYWDGRGREMSSVGLDPENEKAQKAVWDAVQRFRERVQEEMFERIPSAIGRANTEKPAYGFKLNVKYERQHQSRHQTFYFEAARKILPKSTVISSQIGCLIVSNEGDVSRSRKGDCPGYWDGTIGFDQLLKKQYENGTTSAVLVP